MGEAFFNLNSEDENSATCDHVEEEDHGFILMGRISIKHSFGHDMTLKEEDTTTFNDGLDIIKR